MRELLTFGGDFGVGFGFDFQVAAFIALKCTDNTMREELMMTVRMFQGLCQVIFFFLFEKEHSSFGRKWRLFDL